MFCDSCTNRRANLEQLGYMGEQRVCATCYKEFAQKLTKKKRDRTSTISKPVLQASMTLTDSLGRPKRKFHFSLTQNSFRWYKNKDESLSGIFYFFVF